VGLDQRRLNALKEAGLAAVQLSLQALEPGLARRVAGGEFLEAKFRAARWVREAGLPLTINVVLHRLNLHEVEAYLNLARELGASAIELANTQYYSWAWLNRVHLLPDRSALEAAYARVLAWKARNPEALEVVWVVPDYYAEYPKPCMGGVGSNPFGGGPRWTGLALPCGLPPSPGLPPGWGSCPGGHLVLLRGLQPLPGHGLDARALPQLSQEGGGLWGLSLPGLPDYRKPCGHGSCLLSLSLEWAMALSQAWGALVSGSAA